MLIKISRKCIQHCLVRWKKKCWHYLYIHCCLRVSRISHNFHIFSDGVFHSEFSVYISSYQMASFEFSSVYFVWIYFARNEINCVGWVCRGRYISVWFKVVCKQKCEHRESSCSKFNVQNVYAQCYFLSIEFMENHFHLIQMSLA